MIGCNLCINDFFFFLSLPVTLKNLEKFVFPTLFLKLILLTSKIN